jgi:hypothetical protein
VCLLDHVDIVGTISNGQSDLPIRVVLH